MLVEVVSLMEIREVKKEEIRQVSDFLIRTMSDVYPFPLSEASMRDLTEMELLFLNREKASFFAAFSNDQVVGTIAVRPYDGRIVSLKDRYNLETTCEMIKCYVDKNLRKQGIGSFLFHEAERFSKEVGYKMLYLHTHKFLPGGLPFWQKKGFNITLDEQDEFETVHLEKEIF